jgi:signal peptidase I
MEEMVKLILDLLKLIFKRKPTPKPTVINGKYRDLPSPGGIIPHKNVKIQDNIVTIIANGQVYKADVADTNSMDGVFDEGHTPLLEKVNPDLIKVGDIIVYWDGKRYIIHRVVHIGSTSRRYFRTKGDHPDAPIDPLIIRDEHIHSRCFGIIYTKDGG